MKRRNHRASSKSSRYLQKSPADMVTEALMAELRCQLNRAHQTHLQQLEAERRLKQTVDYSWLVSEASALQRPYEIPEMKRIELEQMCGRVEPSECGKVLLAFRQQIADREATQLTTIGADEIPHVFRATVLQVLSLRPAAISERPIIDIRVMSQRLTRSLSSVRLRPGSRASVAPLVIHDEIADSTSSSLTTLCSDGPSARRRQEIT